MSTMRNAWLCLRLAQSVPTPCLLLQKSSALLAWQASATLWRCWPRDLGQLRLSDFSADRMMALSSGMVAPFVDGAREPRQRPLPSCKSGWWPPEGGR